MNTASWNRFFRDDGRAMIVSLDHAISSGLVAGWEHPEETLRQIVVGRPDGIMTNYGILKQFRHLLARQMGLMLRLDGGTSVFGEQWNEYTRWELLYSPEDAVQLGADGAIVMGFFGGPCERDSIRVITRAVAECARVGLPLAVESLPTPSQKIANPYDPELVATAARLGAEYGADFIKTYWTGSAASFRRVVECCPVPVLIAGGDRCKTDRDVLEMVRGMLDAGGRGVFFGRNVWQHHNPGAMVRALVRLIHEDESVDAALQELA